MWKEKHEVKVVTQEFKHGANRSLSVRVMSNNSRYAQQIINTQAGTMKLGLS